MNELIDDMARNPEILRAVGKAYSTISVLGDLNVNARKKANATQLAKELEPNLNAVKEYLLNFAPSVREMKKEIGAESTTAAKGGKKQPEAQSSNNAFQYKAPYCSGWMVS